MTSCSRSRLVLIALVLAGSVLLGAALAQGRTFIVLAVLVPALVMLISFRSELPLAIVLLSVCSVVYAYAYPQIAVGGVRVTWAELALIASVTASVLILAQHGPGFKVQFKGDALLVGSMVAASIAGVLVSIAHGADFKTAVMAMRGVVFYSVCLPAVVALGSRNSQRKTVWFVIAVALAMSVVQVLQSAVGQSLQLIITGDATNLIGLDEATGVLRVRSPGLVLVYVVACFAASAFLWGPRRYRVRAGLILGLSLAGVLVSLNRNMLIGLVAGLLVVALFSRHRTKVVAGLLSIALTGVVVLAIAGGVPSTGVLGRLASIGNAQELVQTTLVDRYYENGLAIAALSKSPLFGVGWATDYGARLSRDPLSGNSQEVREWIHNQYLWLWLRVGFTGLMCAIALLVRGVIAGLDWSKRAPIELGWIGLGVAVAIVAVASSAIVGMYFSSPDSIVPLASVLTLGFVLRNTSPLQDSRE